MAHYTGRQVPGLSPVSSGNGGGFSLGSQLATRRGLNREAPKKIAPVKPSLTTSKEKAGEITKIINKDFVPSGMQLAKLRQLAAQGKLLNPKEARDFLHRSQAGKKLESRESLQKFEAELLKAELEVTKDSVHNPINYKLREGGEAHIGQKAKQLVKGLYKDQAEQAREEAAESSEKSALQDRHDRLEALHAAIRPQAAAPAQAQTHNFRSSTLPNLQAVEPLSSGPTPQPHTASPLVAPPSGVGSHIPGEHKVTDEPNVGLGMPVVVHHEVPVPTANEPTAPATPVFTEPEPLDQPLPAHPSVPSEAPPSIDTASASAGTK